MLYLNIFYPIFGHLSILAVFRSERQKSCRFKRQLLTLSLKNVPVCMASSVRSSAQIVQILADKINTLFHAVRTAAGVGRGVEDIVFQAVNIGRRHMQTGIARGIVDIHFAVRCGYCAVCEHHIANIPDALAAVRSDKESSRLRRVPPYHNKTKGESNK